MSNVIRFLETLGGQPPMSAADYTAAVEGLSVDADVREALKGADASALARLLDGRAAMFCMIVAPEDEEPHEPNPEDKDDDGTPDQDEPPAQSP